MDYLISRGSKNAIAEWLINQLPPAETFVDLFFGGGAITHRAVVSGQYKKFIVNDIDGRLPKFFLDCVYGKYTVDTHKEWISREEFNRLKDTDAYVALIWSFGNNGKDYLYGKDIEQFKHDYHRAVYLDDTSLLEPYGYKVTSTHLKAVYDRYLEFNRQIKQQARCDNEIIERTREIERLQSLQGLQSLQRLQSLQGDYADVEIPKGALVYCDIPYSDSNCGKYQGFDHERFYKWANKQDNIFISEYKMPDEFIPYAKIEKTILSAANGNSQKTTEYLFTNQRTYDKFSDEVKERVKLNFAEQQTFSFLE